ncbi:MAG: SCP2 sterol-binding domain-containing protein [Actinomycetes bacterium]
MGAREFFETLEANAEPDKIVGVEHSYLFDVTGEGRWLVDVRGGRVTVSENPDGPADVTITVGSETFDRIVKGEQNPALAVMTGKIKLEGDTGAALKLQKIF